MKRILLYILIFITFNSYPNFAFAQGTMREYPNPSTTDTPSTNQEEAAGKAVWGKLENKQIQCASLTADDFDVLGDFFMGNMMASNHESINQLITERLGDSGEKRMHIALGKRLSGCDTNAPWPEGAYYFMPLMGFTGTGMMSNASNSSSTKIYKTMGKRFSKRNTHSFDILRFLSWIAVIMFLISGTIFFLKEILRKK